MTIGKHAFIAGAAAWHRAYMHSSVAESFAWATHIWNDRTDQQKWSEPFKRAVDNRQRYLMR